MRIFIILIVFTVATCFSWLENNTACGQDTGNGNPSVSKANEIPGGLMAPAGEKNAQFLLTRQGTIHEGIVTDGEKTVYLQLPQQRGGLTISKLDVVYVAATREALFEYRRAQIPERNAGELLKLADWAVRNQLAVPAIEMLYSLKATLSDPSLLDACDKKIAELRFVEKIRLEALLKKDKKQDPQSPEKALREKESRDMELWSKNVPIPIQEKYIRKIQPILIRRCGSSECHGEQEAAKTFEIRSSLSYSSKRTNSLVNMKGVIDRVNLTQPGRSPILTHPPIKDNQNQPRYPFGNDNNSLKDYEAFLQWINSLSGKVVAVPNTVNSEGTVPGNEPVRTGSGPVPVPSAVVPSTAQTSPVNDSPIQLGITEHGKKILAADPNSTEQLDRRAGRTPAVTPRDSFDPALFNSRYHPEKVVPEKNN